MVPPVPVINSNVFSNPYQTLLYSAIQARYELAKGTPEDALAVLNRDGRGVFHVQWEESALIHCDTRYSARRARERYIRQLQEYRAAGGKIIWTVHNLMPHELKYTDTFMTFRRQLASIADRILVHNSYSIEVLERQVGLVGRDRTRVLPHPSYLGVYEPVEVTVAQEKNKPSDPGALLFFGKIRAYKGVATMLRNLPQSFTDGHGIKIHIRGQPLRAESETREIKEQIQSRTDLVCNLRRVPSSDIAPLFRSVGAVVLPYTRFLTSGVAVLGLTLGVPVVAPDTSQMRELFPAVAHALLFNPRSVRDLRRAVLHAMRLPAARRRLIAKQSLLRAQDWNAHAISLQLGSIYDEVLAGD
jgi:glycosyltransferase involved in cell wall biosynthesis